MKPLGTRATLLSAIPLVVVLGSACQSPTAPVPPFPAPTLTNYHLSGIVTDESGSPIANAQLTLYYNSFQHLTTSTDARGYYDFAFVSSASIYDGNWGVVGALFYTGGGDFENYSVQPVPSGTADIVKNLRLSRVRTVNAGQSLAISIDGDSSVAYDGEDRLRMTGRWERFHLRAADAGTLTIAARAQPGSVVPSLSVFCRYAADNCQFSWVKQPAGSGTASLNVQANSVFEIILAIPDPTEPQRYEIATSIERKSVPALLGR